MKPRLRDTDLSITVVSPIRVPSWTDGVTKRRHRAPRSVGLSSNQGQLRQGRGKLWQWLGTSWYGISTAACPLTAAVTREVLLAASRPEWTASRSTSATPLRASRTR